jgi:DNA repair protein RecO (recombination protein O)
MKVDLNPAFILHRRPYRETSLLLDVFSRDYGRVGLIAKGVRTNKNNKSEILQSYQPLQVAWSGKGELMTLTLADPDKPAYILKDRKLIAGFYLNEIIMRMLHQHEAHPDLFMIYDKTLDLLAREASDEQLVIRLFEKRFLDAIGYGLVLDHDVNGEKIKPECNYYYQVDRGPVLDIPGKHDYIKVSGITLLAIKNEKLDSTQILHEAKLLMRHVLKNHLGAKPLASRKLYKSYLENIK